MNFFKQQEAINMNVKTVKESVKKGYTRVVGQSILLCSSLLFAGEACASLGGGWDDSTSADANRVINNLESSASTLETALITFTQVAGIIVFFGSVYKIYRMKTKHEDTGIGKYILGAVIGVVLFFAPIFMSVGKNTMVGRGS